MKKILKIGLPVLATGCILFIVYAVGGLYPFGDFSIAWGDMTQQVIPLLNELRDMLLGKTGFLLSQQNAGGMNFWGVFLFFIASPFSLLTVFVDKADMMVFMNILVLLKMMVCAMTASLFFDRVFPKLETGFTTALSVAYAFCGYVMLFYQNVIWLDMMYLFPLLLLSLRYLTRTGRFWPYTMCLAGMIVIHFYLSYMVLAFLVLCSCLWIYFHSREDGISGRVVSLGLGTICAGLCTAVVWLPSLLQYFGSARGENLFVSLSQGDFLTRTDTIGMLLLCTSCLVPVFLYRVCCTAFGLERSLDFKVILFSFLLLLIPIIIEPINKMWHTGSYQAFPGRYGYITVFLGLILLADTLAKRPALESGHSKKWAVFAGFAFLALSLAAVVTLLSRHKRELTPYVRTLWGSSQSLSLFLLFALLMAGGYVACYLMYRGGALTRRTLCLFFCLLVTVESVFYSMTFFPQRQDFSYRSVMDLEDRISDDSFYRVKNQEKNYDVNLTGALGYPTLNHYTSLTSEYFMSGIKKLGYSSYWMEVSSIGGTLFSDALLQNKYTIEKKDVLTESDAVYSNGVFQITKNALSLPLGIITHSDLSGQESLPMIQRPYVNEQVFQALFGTQETLFSEYRPNYVSGVDMYYDGNYHLTRTGEENGVLEYILPATEKERTVYFDCFGSTSNALRQAYYGSFEVLVNGTPVTGKYPSQSSNGLLTLKENTKEELFITVRVLKDVDVCSFGVYSMDDGRVEQAVSSAATANLNVQNGRITGTADAAEGDTLFLSLPYDKGYTIKVNGEVREYSRVFDTFLAVPLDAGENQISITYLPPGFRTGLLLSGFGVLLTAALVLLRRRGKLQLAFLQKPAVIVLSVLGGAVFALLYLMPVIVYLIAQLR